MSYVQVTFIANKLRSVDIKNLENKFGGQKISKHKILKELAKEIKYSQKKLSRLYSKNFILAIEKNNTKHVFLKGNPGEWDLFCISKKISRAFTSVIDVHKILQSNFEEKIYLEPIEQGTDKSIENIISHPVMIPLITGFLIFISNTTLPNILNNYSIAYSNVISYLIPIIILGIIIFYFLGGEK